VLDILDQEKKDDKMDFMLQLNKNITFATQNLCSKQEVNELGDSVKQLIQTQVSMIK
jgi:hypothetical protein